MILRWLKWIGLVAAIGLAVSSFMPWVIIESKKIIVSGIDSTGTNFGKPGYLNIILAGLFILFAFIPRVWAMRVNVFISAINLGWALRNYFIISQCRGGDCPAKQVGIYLMLLTSFLLIIAALFPDMKSARVKSS